MSPPLVSHVTRAESFFTHLVIWSNSFQKHSFRTLKNKPALFLDAVQNITRCLWTSSSTNFRPVGAVSAFVHEFSAFPYSLMKWQEDPWNRLDFSVRCSGFWLSMLTYERAGRPLNRARCKRKDWKGWTVCFVTLGFPCWHAEGQETRGPPPKRTPSFLPFPQTSLSRVFIYQCNFCALFVFPFGLVKGQEDPQYRVACKTKP